MGGNLAGASAGWAGGGVSVFPLPSLGFLHLRPRPAALGQLFDWLRCLFDLRFHPVSPFSSSWKFLQPEDKSRVADETEAEALRDDFDGLLIRRKQLILVAQRGGGEEGSGAASKPSRANVCRHHGQSDKSSQPDVQHML